MLRSCRTGLVQVGRTIRRGYRAIAGFAVLLGVAATVLVAGPAQAVPRSHVWAWGYGGGGELGIGPVGPGGGARVVPVPVHGLPDAVKQVAATDTLGLGPVVALLAGGTVWVWGPGPLGNGSTSGSDSPVQLTSLSGSMAVAATALGNYQVGPPYNTFYALRRDGTVWAWGYGGNGELGDGSFADSLAPVRVSGLSGVTSIVAGGDTVYALRKDGTVWAWGAGASGQLGNGSSAASDVPVRVSLADRAIRLASACGSAYALTGGRRVFAWGDNATGQLGNGTRAAAATPVLVRGVHGASSVVAGCFDAYATVAGGKVMAWGQGAQGEMGDGHTATRLNPVTVPGLSGITQISVGYCAGCVARNASAYAVRTDGTLWAWGYGREGQLGDGLDANSSVPVRLTSITSPVTSVVPGVNSTVARGTDGSLWSWGNSGFGATGSGGSGANPGRVPRVPPASGVFTVSGITWFAGV